VAGPGLSGLAATGEDLSMTVIPIRCVPLATALGATLFAGCPEFSGPTGGGTISDVPCLIASEWSTDSSSAVHRRESTSGDTVLFTGQTQDQFYADVNDGTRDFLPHQAVYRFEPEFGQFSVVDDSLWVTAQGEICSGCPRVVLGGPLEIQDGRLLFNGAEVPVAGRRAARIFDAAASECGSTSSEAGNVAAVLSIDGYVALLGASTGQHYHQLFSNVDGSRIGGTIRLAIGGLGHGTVLACWSSDRKFVLYQDGPPARICVVPVADALAGAGEN